MLCRRIVLASVSIVFAVVAGAVISAQPPAANDCAEWHECQRLAESAAQAGEYETFHDLAWRAVQKGPRNDPALMFMLARAQSLSGRPHDAIVMLERIADMGALAPEAIATEDFRRARQLPAWADVEARITATAGSSNSMLPPASGVERAPARTSNRATESSAASSAAPSATVLAPGAGVADAPAAPTAPSRAAVRFSAAPFAVGGLAYDAVSQRFLLGDRHGRKVIVVGDGSDHSVDLARAASGGFREVAAIAIDPKRGDLWIASAGDPDGGGLLHKLQLISGRTLKSFPLAADGGPVHPIDLTVTPAGAVLVLDAAAPQLMVLRPGQGEVERVAHLSESNVSSITVGDDEDAAYIAHDGGISRVNVRTGSTVAVAMSGEPLGRVESLRWYRRALIAVEQRGGSRRIVRLPLNDRGTAVTRQAPIAENISGDGRVAAAISGDDLVYVLTPDAGDQSAAEQVVVYRVALR